MIRTKLVLQEKSIKHPWLAEKPDKGFNIAVDYCAFKKQLNQGISVKIAEFLNIDERILLNGK